MTTMEMNLIIGLAIMFGLALVMSYLTYKDIESFFIFLTIFSGFIVWSGLIELWILIVNIIILILIITNNLSKRRFIL